MVPEERFDGMGALVSDMGSEASLILRKNPITRVETHFISAEFAPRSNEKGG